MDAILLDLPTPWIIIRPGRAAQLWINTTENEPFNVAVLIGCRLASGEVKYVSRHVAGKLSPGHGYIQDLKLATKNVVAIQVSASDVEHVKLQFLMPKDEE